MGNKKSDRELALEWWKRLSNPEKEELCNSSSAELTGHPRHFLTLTGREVEIIWRKQANSKNMKTIFVTIKEFLENGGELEIGRKIYREESRHFNSYWFDNNQIFQRSIAYGEYIGEDKERGTYLVKNESFKSMPLTETTGYVRIEAKPIYK